MNVENILRVADAIEKRTLPRMGFKMSAWIDVGVDKDRNVNSHRCNTTACIGGWAVALFDGEKHLKAISNSSNSLWSISPVYARAKDLFDLSEKNAYKLFVENASVFVTSEEAIATLRYLAVTGKVVWDPPTTADIPL